MDDVELNKRRKRLGNAVRVERVEQRLSQERLGLCIVKLSPTKSAL